MKWWFCKHKWEEVGRTYNPPRGRQIEVTFTSESEIARILHGFTNIEMQCEHCGTPKVTRVTGKCGKFE